MPIKPWTLPPQDSLELRQALAVLLPAELNATLATLYKPQGDGPFAVIIFNHGSTGPGVIPADRTENPSGYGAYLLKKDIALLIPMRRGRGKSEGTYL